MDIFPVFAPPDLLTRSWPGKLPRSVWPEVVAQSKTASLRAVADKHGVSQEAIGRTLKHAEVMSL